MEVINKIKVIFPILFLILPISAFAYDNLLVHPELTKAAISLYNQNSSENKIYNWQKELILTGVSAEDNNTRFLHHFYNPDTGEGLYGNFSSAKAWAFHQPSGEEDYSVPTILENYKDGDIERAYEGVGHILHLLQDMAVPAHTRDDDHKSENFFQDPYENWVEHNININLSRIKFTVVDDLLTAFDQLAEYSHNNFFSANTIESVEKKIIRKKEVQSGAQYAICLDSFGIEFYCLRAEKKLFGVFYNLDDPLVHQDYWQLLYPKAVGYSAGVIDYFQKEFAKIDYLGEEYVFNNTKRQDITEKVRDKPNFFVNFHSDPPKILSPLPVQAKESKNLSEKKEVVSETKKETDSLWKKIKLKTKFFFQLLNFF